MLEQLGAPSPGLVTAPRDSRHSLSLEGAVQGGLGAQVLKAGWCLASRLWGPWAHSSLTPDLLNQRLRKQPGGGF